MSTALPGAAEKVSAATRVIGGTRCSRPLTVTQSTRGFSTDERERARRASTVMRRALIEALGEARS